MIKNWVGKIQEFFKPKVEIRYIEVPKVRETTPDDKASAAALATHPGFNYLLHCLRQERLYLESVLKSEHQESLREVDNLKAGIQWAGWLERKLRAVNAELDLKRTATEPPLDDLDAFNRIQQFVEVVGKNQTPQG